MCCAIKRPELPRNKVPGGKLGLAYIVIAPASIIILAIVSQVRDFGWEGSIGWGLIAIAVGALLYMPIRRWVKKDVPDVDPYVLNTVED